MQLSGKDYIGLVKDMAHLIYDPSRKKRKRGVSYPPRRPPRNLSFLLLTSLLSSSFISLSFTIL
jgi:hypothetical protein